jgi:hypothetical protein
MQRKKKKKYRIGAKDSKELYDLVGDYKAVPLSKFSRISLVYLS